MKQLILHLRKFQAVPKSLMGIPHLKFVHLPTWSCTCCDELKVFEGWKVRSMVDLYAKFATEHLAKAENRLNHFGENNVIEMSRSDNKKGLEFGWWPELELNQ